VSKKKFVLMAYAHELKLRIQKDFDLSYDQLWGDEKEIEDKRYPNGNSFWTPREIMQFIGTECMRVVDDNFWVKALFRKIDENEYKNVILTDVRFPNEAQPIIDRSGYVIKVTSNRDGKTKVHGDDHPSETSMDNYDKVDFHVRNDGSLGDLRDIAKQVVSFLIKSEKMRKKFGG